MPQYNGVWTLEAQAQAQSNQQWVTDPNFKNTTLLLQADGAANTAQNNLFLDTSSNQFAITRNGNTTQGSFSPFSQAPGYWSAYCAGSGYNPIYVDAGTACAYGTGDFTVELFFYSVGTTSANQVIFDQRPNATNGLYPVIYLNNTSGKLVYQTNSADRITADNPFSFNVWTHIVVSRVSGTTRMFINGTQQTTTYADTNNYLNGASRPILGHGFANNSAYPNGYYSNVRVLKGTGVTSVTVPTSKLENIANTSLLICQSNRFVDNSTANSGSGFTVLTSGTPSVQAFGPFAPALQWTPDVVSGSGYFDGTGDYLTVADTTALEPDTGDFCWESWVYHTTAASASNVYTEQTGGGLAVYRTAAGKVQVDKSGVANVLTSANNVPVNAWTHIAVTRSGTTLRIFINGAIDASTTYSTSLAGTSAISYGASPTGSATFTGYLSNVRFVKASAVYTVAFTPPTAPLTAISGTSILLNYTNAGIYDATMANNLETVGNAQVATSPVKYGSGSMAFDGTGDWLSVPYKNANFPDITQASQFTLECWIFPTSFNTAQATICGTRLNGITGWEFRLSTAGVLQIYNTGGAATVSSSISVSLNTWTHVAAVKTMSTLITLYINGINVGSGTFASATATTNPLYIGGDGVNNDGFIGYIDDLRITQGVARYYQNFTPPQQALPRQ